LKSYGQYSRNPNQSFNQPRGLTLDKDNLYICDTNNHRIQVVKKENGEFQKRWGKCGDQDNEFQYPLSIYLDTSDLIYVGDNVGVQIFTLDGLFFQRLGGKKKGNTMTEFNGVYGISILDETLYISDYYNNRILIFGK